jgi:molecular chaperone DnaJ
VQSTLTIAEKSSLGGNCMATGDYYEVLGVPRSASDDEIKKAYRRLVLQYHPDRNPGDSTAEAKIREVNAAYEIIGDPETRRSYERLRFGDEERDERPDPDSILDAMDQKLYDEGRKELFAVLMQNVKKLKSELSVIRERTVDSQGYDTFKETVVLERAVEVLPELVTAEMEGRKKRLLEVAIQMMGTQAVIRLDDERQLRDLKVRFDRVYERGRLNGFRDALELFYQRR